MALPILLAEDDPITREALSVHLLQLGFQVLACSGFQAAQQALREQTFDYLILDRNLPGGGALALLRAAQADPSAPNHATPAIVISADIEPAQRAALLALGFIAVLQKPISATALGAALQPPRPSLPVAPTPALSPATPTAVATLDDAMALTACGTMEVVVGLRRLLAAEIGGFALQLQQAGADQDREKMRDTLHRLRSALGFCGGAELLQLIADCPSALPSETALQHILDAAERLRRQLPLPVRLPLT